MTKPDFRPKGLSHRDKRPGVVLDTITTRFLMLFIIVLVIPLFSLGIFSRLLLQSQVSEAIESQNTLNQKLIEHRLAIAEESLDRETRALADNISSPDLAEKFCDVSGLDTCLLVNPNNHTVTQPHQGVISYSLFEKNDPGLLEILNRQKDRGHFYIQWKNGLHLLKSQSLKYPLYNKNTFLVTGFPLEKSLFQKQIFEEHTGIKSFLIPLHPNNSETPQVFMLNEERKTQFTLDEILPYLNRPAASKTSEINIQNNSYRIMEKDILDPDNQKIATIVSLFPLDFEEAIMSRYYMGLVFIMIAGLLFSAMLAMLAARPITRPLLQLIREVNTLNLTGDLSHEVTAQGVYEINQLAGAFNRMLQQLLEEQKRKDEFVATLTHDLKVPMLAEKQTLDYMDKETYGTLTETQREVVHVLKSSNESTLSLVNGILEIYRYESGQATLVFDYINIAELLEETVEECRTLAESKNITLTFDNPVVESVARCDRLEIKRVLLNLLSNAITNTPRFGQIKCSLANSESWGSGSITHFSKFTHSTIRSPLQLSDRILISIQDSGIGFTQEDLPRLFKQFGANKGRNPMSTGLGLYNAYQVIQAHGGTLWVETTEGEGSAVSFLLPANEAVARDRRKFSDRRKD